MNPEIYEHAAEELFRSGARDVWMHPVYMKKNRPGMQISCICEEKVKDKVIDTIFRQTTTIGIRILYPDRIEMDRKKSKVNTKYGKIDIKISKHGPNIINIAPEYESCRKAARKYNIPLKDIYVEARAEAKKKLDFY